jgi:hypothetical protein
MNDATKATGNERLAFTVASCISTLVVIFLVVIQLMYSHLYIATDAISCALLAFVAVENIRLCKHSKTMFALSTSVIIMLIGIMALCFVLNTEVMATKRYSDTTIIPALRLTIPPASSGTSGPAH